MTTGYAVDPARSTTAAHSRRRPSGEPPPLPHRINNSGRWWLALALMVVVCWILVATIQRTAVALDVVDHAVLDRIASVRTPWLTQVMKVVGLPVTRWALPILWLA